MPTTIPNIPRYSGAYDRAMGFGFTGGASAGSGGGSPFGTRIGAIPMPDPSGDLSRVYPNLSGTNAATSAALLSKLHGQLSPDTINMIQNSAAQFGAGSGMPGFNPGSLDWNRSLRDIGRTSEDQIQQGLQDYSPIINAVSGTQTVNPALQAEISATNATNAAAPDPAAAASYAQELFDKYLAQLKGPAGGSGGAGGGVPWYTQGTATGPSWGAAQPVVRIPGAAGGGHG